MIYVFGNSHAHFFTGTHPATFREGNCNEYFRSFSLGPIIAYNFVNHHFQLMLDWISELPITTEDYILFAIGEVDCRWHLPKQAELQKRNPIDVTKECLDRFFPAYLFLKKYNYKVLGWGGHPSTTDGHREDESCPVFGDCLYRNKISKYWNSYIQEKCKEHQIPFVSIFYNLINEEGYTKMEYYNDYCHLNTEKCLPIVIKKLKKINII